MIYKILLALLLSAAGGCTNAPDTTINCSTVSGEIWLDCGSPLCEDGNCTPLTDEEIQQFEEQQPREEYEEGGA